MENNFKPINNKQTKRKNPIYEIKILKPTKTVCALKNLF